MIAIESHREALKWASELLEMTMADVTDEQAHWHPPGTANPLGATYTHAICSLDAVTNMLLQGKDPLFTTDWAGKTGISEPQWGNEYEWARRLQIDLPTARRYAQAVYTEMDAYIASLSEEDLSREMDLTRFGVGMQTVNWCLNALAIGHLNNMAGEISVLKGVQGAKGYPF
jgi:hypothetical protein